MTPCHWVNGDRRFEKKGLSHLKGSKCRMKNYSSQDMRQRNNCEAPRYRMFWVFLPLLQLKLYIRSSLKNYPLIVNIFQITNLMHNSFIFQQYVCYTTLLNMFRAARCSKHVEDCSVTFILLKNKRIVH